MCVDDVINAERLPAKVGEEVVLDRVLLVGTPAYSLIGRPMVPGAAVRARVSEQVGRLPSVSLDAYVNACHALFSRQTRDAKVIIFKKRRRKGYQRKKGFRRYVTMLEVRTRALALPRGLLRVG